MAHKYTLPKLAYDYSALEPVISGEIMQLHHQKHHNGYVTNLNAALEKYEQAEKNNDLDAMIALQSAIRFNGGGHINHSIFWTNLAPKGHGGEPQGDLRKQLDHHFGSFDGFVQKFNALAAPVQGSGWCWLGFCPKSQQVMIQTCSNQDPLYATHGLIPLLGVDVWEHAYYLQYKNVRPDYLKAIWQVINWNDVAMRFETASNLSGGSIK